MSSFALCSPAYHACSCALGAILAFMLGIFQIPLEECEEMYRKLGSDVFKQNVIVGTVKMGWSHAFYDSEIWENILKLVCKASFPILFFTNSFFSSLISSWLYCLLIFNDTFVLVVNAKRGYSDLSCLNSFFVFSLGNAWVRDV